MFVFITIFFAVAIVSSGLRLLFFAVGGADLFFCPAECREVWFHSTVLLRCSTRWLSAGVRNGR